MIIKRLERTDIDIALSLIRGLKDPQAEQEALNDFLSSGDNYLIGAFDDDQPVGFAIAYILNRTDISRPMLYIHEIEVAEAYRGQGIGRQIMEKLHGISRNRKALKMFVITGSDNEAAMRLYESAGGKRLIDSDAVFEFRN